MITSRIRILRCRGTKMKRPVTIILITAIVVSVFMACSTNSSSEDVSTTAVTDKDSSHFYETVTNANGEIVTAQNGEKVFAEIETNNDGTAVTKSNGEFVTKEKTTVFSNQNTSSKANSNSSSGGSSDDNEVVFDPDSEGNTTSENLTQNTTITTEPTTNYPSNATTQSATDADGWINKWY